MKKTLFLLPLLALAGCKPDGASQPGAMPPPQVGVLTLQAEPLSLTADLPGRLTAERTAEVRARATGILLKRLFTEGADVKVGELLFQIDEEPLQAILNSAQAQLAKAEANQQLARANAERNKQLAATNVISKQAADEVTAAAALAEADILNAKAAVATARLNLGYAKVTAPISGRIGRAKITEGALVSAVEATPMATIQQLDPILFDFPQSSAEMLRLRQEFDAGRLKIVGPGQAKIALLLEDGTLYPHAGKLLFSEVTVDPTTGMVTLRAEFPNPERLLLPGMFARARLEQAVQEAAITVPQRALTRNSDGTGTVFIVNKENRVEARIVSTSKVIGDKWLVTSGLQAGDTVILEGLQKVRPNAPVQPVPFQTEQKPTGK